VSRPKPEPYARTKARKARALAKQDTEQRAICRERSGGRCEVIELRRGPEWIRCGARATENHHLLSGRGIRNRGNSLLADYRLDICHACHTAITHRVLLPVPELPDDWAGCVRYKRRVR
jgi:hypothetical protein